MGGEKRRLGALALAAGAAGIAFSAVLNKTILEEGLSPLWLNVFRLGFSCLFLLPFFLRDAGARKARQQVLQLRQLHLQFALAGAGARGEDVQNQRRAVHYLQAQGLFEVFLHHAGELLVEDDQIGLRSLAAQAQLLRLAFTHAVNRIGLGTLLQNAQHRFRARRFGQLLQFVQRFLAFDAHQHGALPSRPRGGIGGTVRRVRALDFRKPLLLRLSLIHI